MTFSNNYGRLNWRTFWCCAFLSLGAFCYGYAAMIISMVLGQPGFSKYMGLIDAEGNPSSNQAALVGATVGLFCAGGCIGVATCSWTLDAWGRKRTMVFLVFVYTIGAVLISASQNIAMFTVARTIHGFAAVGFIGATSTYIAELAQAESRGFLTGLTGVAVACGYTIAALMGLAFSYTTNPDVQWRIPVAMSLVPSTLLFVVLLFTPESPRWLLLKDRPEEAWQVISNLHRNSVADNEVYIKEEFLQMRTQLEFDRTLDSSWVQLFRKPSYRKRVLMACLVTFLGQSTAVLVVAAYGPSLYAALGFNVKDSLILQCGWIAGSIPASITGVSLCDRFGRKPFIMVGYVGCIVALIILTAMEAVYAPDGTNKVGLGWAVAACYLIVIFYCLGVEACGNPFYTELFPTHIRAKGVSFQLFINSASNLLYQEVAPTALQNIQWRFLLVFICILTVGSVLYWFWVPETRLVPLEELAAIFGDLDEVKVYSNNLSLAGEEAVANREIYVPESKELESPVVIQQE